MKIELDEDVGQAVRAFLERLTEAGKLQLFGLPSVGFSAYHGAGIFCLFIGSETDIAASDERTLRTGSPLAGVRCVATETGSVYIDKHEGALWLEGGGTIVGGLTLIGMAPCATVGIKNIMLQRGGARAYRVRWAFVAATGNQIGESNIVDRLIMYLQ